MARDANIRSESLRGDRLIIFLHSFLGALGGGEASEACADDHNSGTRGRRGVERHLGTSN